MTESCTTCHNTGPDEEFIHVRGLILRTNGEHTPGDFPVCPTCAHDLDADVTGDAWNYDTTREIRPPLPNLTQAPH